MNFCNLTPHAIVFRLADGTDKTFPPSPGGAARVATTEKFVPSIMDADGQIYPVVSRALGAVQMPADVPAKGALIVSSMVLDAAKAQNHPLLARMIAPDTGPTAIREAGQVKAVTRWVVA